MPLPTAVTLTVRPAGIAASSSARSAFGSFLLKLGSSCPVNDNDDRPSVRLPVLRHCHHRAAHPERPRDHDPVRGLHISVLRYLLHNKVCDHVTHYGIAGPVFIWRVCNYLNQCDLPLWFAHADQGVDPRMPEGLRAGSPSEAKTVINDIASNHPTQPPGFMGAGLPVFL